LIGLTGQLLLLWCAHSANAAPLFAGYAPLKWAFLIEDVDALSARLGGLHVEPRGVTPAALVDADYAGPNPVYAARSVRTRHYQGYCTSIDTLQAALAVIQAQRDALFALVETTDGLTEGSRKRARNYLQQFFSRMARSGVEPLHKRCLAS
jgi:hypothetical protein